MAGIVISASLAALGMAGTVCKLKRQVDREFKKYRATLHENDQATHRRAEEGSFLRGGRRVLEDVGGLHAVENRVVPKQKSREENVVAESHGNTQEAIRTPEEQERECNSPPTEATPRRAEHGCVLKGGSRPLSEGRGLHAPETRVVPQQKIREEVVVTVAR